jgi:hypothetical protein
MGNPAEIIEFQKKQEAKFICSACGADRGCDCNAPAVEKLAEKLEQDRQRAKRAREKKKTSRKSINASRDAAILDGIVAGEVGDCEASIMAAKETEEERDRKECVALAEKVANAEKALADFKREAFRITGGAEVSIEQRRAEYAALDIGDSTAVLSVEDDLEGEPPEVFRRVFLLRCLDALGFGVYSGPVDNEVIAAAERVAAHWQDFTQTLKARCGNNTPDDLSIPPPLRRT